MDTPDRALNLAVAATFSAGPIQPALAFWMDELGLPARIELAPYNQPFQELLDPASLLSSNVQGVNIVLLRLEDWLTADSSARRGEAGANVRHDLEQKVADFIDAVSAAVRRSAVSWLLVVCPASPGIDASTGQSAFLTELEGRLVDGLSDVAGIGVVTSSALTSGRESRNQRCAPAPGLIPAPLDSWTTHRAIRNGIGS